MNDAKVWLKETWQKVNGSNAMKWLKILGGVALGILALTALIAGVYKIFLKRSGIIKPKKKTSGSTAKKRNDVKKEETEHEGEKMNKQKNAKKSPPRGNPQRVRKKL